MNRLLPLLVLVVAVAGCSRRESVPTPERPSPHVKLEIKIEAERTTFKVGEDPTIMITIKNLTSQDLPAPETYWSASVLFDEKEYKRLMAILLSIQLVLLIGCERRTEPPEATEEFSERPNGTSAAAPESIKDAIPSVPLSLTRSGHGRKQYDNES